MNKLVKYRSLPNSILAEFSRMNEIFNDFLGWIEEDDFFKDFFKPDRRRISARPKLDISETDKEYKLVADVAGMSKEDIKIQVRDNCVILSGEKTSETDNENDKDRKVIYSELSHREFRRVIPFYCDVDVDTASAIVRDGLLTVTIPKKEPAVSKSKDVEVKVA